MRVIITGAASGIGRACAELLAGDKAAPGERKMLLSDRDGSNLAAVADGIGASASTCVIDLAEIDCGDRIVAAALDHMGGIDAVVSNAGILMRGALADLAVGDFDRTFAINTRSAWLLGKAAYPHLKESRGTFIATTSISATHPTLSVGFYSCSKAALLMMMRQLCVEWGPDGIRCNTVSPGPTYTPMIATFYEDEAHRKKREASIPLRKLGMAEDVANAILFLLGPGATHISGVDLLVDGGLSNMLMPASSRGIGDQQKN
ncbi:SDR family NAD(P)-dependent oxidoreductase [Bradyrhizobium sp. 5.13L]